MSIYKSGKYYYYKFMHKGKIYNGGGHITLKEAEQAEIEKCIEFNYPKRKYIAKNRNSISSNVLNDLYWNEKLSHKEIANKIGYSEDHIRRLFRQYTIPTRNPRDAAILALSKYNFCQKNNGLTQTENIRKYQLEKEGWKVIRPAWPDFLCYKKNGHKYKFKLEEIKTDSRSIKQKRLTKKQKESFRILSLLCPTYVTVLNQEGKIINFTQINKT